MWLKNFNWGKLGSKAIDAPFKPDPNEVNWVTPEEPKNFHNDYDLFKEGMHLLD